MTTTYVITGANRGIGRALTDLILARPHTTVLALVRDPGHETSRSLASTPRAPGTQLVIVPYDAKDPDAAATAIATAETTQGITLTRLDVVIANAGMVNQRGPTVDTTPEAIHEHITVNAIAPLLLFRACLPLLQRGLSSGQETERPPAKFIAIGSAIGSTTLISKFPHAQTLPYGLSKAALHHTVRKLSVDYPDLVIEVLTPGPVRTDLMREFRDFFEKALKANPRLADGLTPIDKVAEGLLGLIDSANKDTSGGFRDWKGDALPW